MKIIPIPTSTEDDFGKVIYKLLQLDDIISQSQTSEVTLDFTNTRFLHSIFLSGLFCLVKKWESQFQKRIQYQYTGSAVETYLRTVSFPGGLLLGDTDSLAAFRTKTYTPLVLFSSSEHQREHSIASVIELIKTQIKPTISVGQAIDHFITELTNNVGDHSESKNGLLSVQAYVKKRFVDICIADFGIGIFASYEKSDKFFPTNELDAISMAINGRSTKLHHISRGFGISTSKEILVKELNGNFLLWSGNGMYVQTSNKDARILQIGNSYLGCFVCIRLTTDHTFDFYRYMN
jgi:anti-sigma regulatory factor (Ser/Thr protein kinase)